MLSEKSSMVLMLNSPVYLKYSVGDLKPFSFLHAGVTVSEPLALC